MGINSQCQSTAEDAIFLPPLSLNSADSAPAVSTLTTITTNTSHHNIPLMKASLSLPTTAEGWEQADSYFQTSLVPAALAVTSPQEMSRVLCERIYSYFATCGTTTTTIKKIKPRPLHNRALTEVERKKEEAKRELRSARRSGSPADVVHSLAHHFISLFRAHSQLKRVWKARLVT